MIEIKCLSKDYKKEKVLYNISFKINDNGILFILGGHKSGRSTLINLISCVDDYKIGDIIINGKSTKNEQEVITRSYLSSFISCLYYDHNLIETSSVKSNIKFIANLYKIKMKKEDINNIIKLADLDEKRNINVAYLSAFDRQKLALVLALVKNPEIILMDEPFKNLSSIESRKFLDIVKKISKDKMIVIATNDVQLSNEYASRVIKLNNGEIVGDSKPCDLENFDLESKKYHNNVLPMIYAIYLGFTSLIHKPLKLLFIYLIMTLDIIFLVCLFNNNLFDANKEYKNYLKKNNVNYVKLKKSKTKVNYLKYLLNNNEPEYIKFNEEEINTINKNLGLNLEPEYVINNESNSAMFSFADQTFTNLYYKNNLKVSFYETNNYENIIGNKPDNFNEIVISNYIADNIIKLGIKDIDGNTYKPLSYKDIVNDNRYIYIENLGYYKVSGIINYNLDWYLKYKNNATVDNLYNEFNESINILFNRIYVLPNFTNNFHDNDVKIAFKASKVGKDDKSYYSAKIGTLNKSIDLYDGYNILNLTKMKNDEIVIDVNMLNNLTNNDYRTKLDESLRVNQDYSEQAVTEFTKRYVRESGIVGTRIYSNVSSSGINSKTKNYYKVLAVAINDTGYTTTYYSLDNIEKLLNDTVEIKALYTKTDYKNIEKIINKYPINKSMIVSVSRKSDYYAKINSIIETIKFIAKIGFIIGTLYVLILINKYNNSSVVKRKNEISYLKVNGILNKDIKKVFIIERLLFLCIGYEIIKLIINPIILLLNNIIGYIIGLNYNYISMTLYNDLFIAIFMIILLLATSLFTAKKIYDSEPINMK